MPHRFPALIAAPPSGQGRLWLTGARLFDGTGSPVSDGAAVLVEDGVIRRVASTKEPCPDGARLLDDQLRELSGQRTLVVSTHDPARTESFETVRVALAA